VTNGSASDDSSVLRPAIDQLIMRSIVALGSDTPSCGNPLRKCRFAAFGEASNVRELPFASLVKIIYICGTYE